MAQHYTGAPDWVQCGEKSVFVGVLLNREIAGVFEMIPRAVNGYLEKMYPENEGKYEVERDVFSSVNSMRKQAVGENIGKS